MTNYRHVPIIGTVVFDYRHLHEQKINENKWRVYGILLSLLCTENNFLGRFDRKIFSYKNEINGGKLTCYDMSSKGYVQLSKCVMASQTRKRGRSHSWSASPVLRSPSKIKKLKQWSINSMTAAVDAVLVQQALLTSFV